MLQCIIFYFFFYSVLFLFLSLFCFCFFFLLFGRVGVEAYLHWDILIYEIPCFDTAISNDTKSSSCNWRVGLGGEGEFSKQRNRNRLCIVETFFFSKWTCNVKTILVSCMAYPGSSQWCVYSYYMFIIAHD